MYRWRFFGGTLAYIGTGEQADFLNIGADGRVFIYEGAKIDDGGQSITIAQPLLKPTGDGVTGIEVSGTPVNYNTPPSLRITGGGGYGATAIAQTDSAGAVTNILVTCPGVDYTSTPTVNIDRGSGSGLTIGAITTATNAWDGGLTKLGSGTLTLTATNTYAGPTIVSNGTLRLTHADGLSPDTDVYLYTGTILDLAFSGKVFVHGLYINDVLLPAGVYGMHNMPTYFDGTGQLRSTSPEVFNGVLFIVR